MRATTEMAKSLAASPPDTRFARDVNCLLVFVNDCDLHEFNYNLYRERRNTTR